MARNADQQQIFNKERNAGRKAAKMAEEYILALMRQRLTIHNKGGVGDWNGQGFGPLMKETTVKAKMGQFRLLGLNFDSSKAGFVNHFGFTGIREATTVLLSASRYNKTATKRKAHPFHLPAQRYLDDMYKKSGALDFLLKSLAETRTDAVKYAISGIVYSLNLQDKDNAGK